MLVLLALSTLFALHATAQSSLTRCQMEAYCTGGTPQSQFSTYGEATFASRVSLVELASNSYYSTIDITNFDTDTTGRENTIQDGSAASLVFTKADDTAGTCEFAMSSGGTALDIGDTNVSGGITCTLLKKRTTVAGSRRRRRAILGR